MLVLVYNAMLLYSLYAVFIIIRTILTPWLLRTYVRILKIDAVTIQGQPLLKYRIYNP